MKQFVLPFILLLLFSTCKAQNDADTLLLPADFVDPFIGTGGHGHTFPGATVPFGMVQLSPDTRMNSWDGCSGYHTSDSTVIGFSHTHLSGTGCSDYGDFRFMPLTGEVKFDKGEEADTQSGYRSAFRHEDETAKAGYYSVLLKDYGILAELTAGQRIAMHRYTYNNNEAAHILLDLVEGVDDEHVYESFLHVENDHAISGYRRTKDWAKDQRLYFYAEFSKPFKAYSIINKGETIRESYVESDHIKAAFDFDTDPGESVVMRIALSPVDVEGAKNNLKAELGDGDFDFDTLVQKAFESWNTELKRYEVKGGSDADKTVFYTALYHAMVAPNLFSDADGRYRAHDMQIHRSEQPVYTVFSLWDTFRSLHPLFNLMQRDRTPDFIATFIDNAKTGGGLLPVWELAACETNCMIGYHAVPVIADAYFCGIRGFDTEQALQYMVTSADADLFGRKAFRELGFIPTDVEGESVSKTLEYAYDDWCIARMAEGMGKTDIANDFYHRAQAYKNIYNPENQFFQGRRNGGFMTPFDPAQVNFTLTEANSWQYGFFVPHDVNTHIDMMGGREVYEERLDALFNAASDLTGRVQPDITGLIGQYAHGNEPSHNTIYMYNFVGKPHKTQQYVKQVMDAFYSDERDGYSGNEDCGQMSAWAVFSAMGFYPATPASGYYVLGLPRFERVTLHLENGKQFVVKAKHFEPKNAFVKSVKLDGKKLERSFVYFDEIWNGGELEFVMTDQPNSTWATRPENCPVQRIERDKIVVVPTINGASDTFFDSLLITLSHPVKGMPIHFTCDGTTPDENSPVYSDPFYIKTTTTIQAAACREGKWSKAIATTFHHMDAKHAVRLENPYNSQYQAGGDIALIDHQRGGGNFRTGTWQGYYGVDLIATVDLGEEQPVHRLAGSFLQEQASWIFMPKEVEFFVSDDGKNFRSIGKVQNRIPETAEGAMTQELEARCHCKARYVKMIAKTIGICPGWHVGAGSKAWIFCDEFIIE